MFSEKTIQLNKKVKLKSMKQVVDICLKKGFNFEFINNILTVEFNDDYGYTHESSVLNVKNFGKKLVIDSALIDFDDDGSVISTSFFIGESSFPAIYGVFFENFPRLTKAQKSPPITALPPAIVASLLSGDDTHPNLDLEYLEDGTLNMGFLNLDKKQMLNIFIFLSECLAYDAKSE